MDITRLFLVCMGINIVNVKIVDIVASRYTYSYYCSVLFIGSCSSYVVSDLNNLLSYPSLVFVTILNLFIKIILFNFLFLSFIILIFYHYNLNTISMVNLFLLIYSIYIYEYTHNYYFSTDDHNISSISIRVLIPNSELYIDIYS